MGACRSGLNWPSISIIPPRFYFRVSPETFIALHIHARAQLDGQVMMGRQILIFALDTYAAGSGAVRTALEL